MQLEFGIGYGPVGGFSQNTVVGFIAVTIQSANTPAVTQNLAPNTAQASFANVAADVYTWTVQAFDGSTPPVALGSAHSGTFTVVTPPVTITLNLPNIVAVSQSNT